MIWESIKTKFWEFLKEVIGNFKRIIGASLVIHR